MLDQLIPGNLYAFFLVFARVGAVIMLPIILGYTAYVFWIFRGKMSADAGYHH